MDVTKLLNEIAGQLPSIVAFIILVVLFGRYMSRRDSSFEKTMVGISEQCHAVQKRGHDVQDRIATSLNENTAVTAEMKGVMINVDKTMADTRIALERMRP